MSGLIGVIAQETARFSVFGSSLSEMDKPEGWEVKWRFGWDLADSHNALIQEMLNRNLDYLWILGDDHAFSPNTLRKLLARQVDIVVPLCLMRNAPFRPVNFTADPLTTDGFSRLNLDHYPEGGLIDVEVAGGAGMLIRREVFDTIPRPWFETGGGITNRVGEDVNFCHKARAAGYKIHCDLDTVIGHCCTAIVWPVREHDGWTYAFSMAGDYQLTLPPKTGWMLADAHA